MTKVFLHLVIAIGIGCSTVDAADLEDRYSWSPMRIGGGGWVVGMDISPTEKDLIYVRTDVAGAYRWDAADSTWKQVVTSESLPTEYVQYGTYRGVDSLVSAPNDPQIAYMAYHGQIFRSLDRGETWVATTFGGHRIRMEPNGEGRQAGERLAVDPHNSDVVYYGSIADGLWFTADAGVTWERIAEVPAGMPPHGANTIVFDKNSGSVGSAGGRTRVIYVTVDQVGIFRSGDAGATWSHLSEGGPERSGQIRDAEIGVDGTYYVAYERHIDGTGAIWKRAANGEWEDITPTGESGANRTLCEIAVDPNDPLHLVAMRNGGTCSISRDQGETWTNHGFRLSSPKIKWLGEQENYWLSVGELCFDPFESGRLWFAEGFGVWRADARSSLDMVWHAESVGIEETCGNDVICPPGGSPVAAMWDVGVFVFDNPDEYSARRAYPYFMSAWALDWCAADPQFLVAVFRNHLGFAPHINASGFSSDGGKTWTNFPAIENREIPPDLDYGIIAVSANSPDKIVWAPVGNRIPYFTTDRGVTWEPSQLGDGVAGTGLDFHYTPQKSLCADRVIADTFYFYHTHQGVFRSGDGGATFSKTTGSPPTGRVNSVLKSIPGHAGHLLFAEGHQGNPVGGLWLSADGGETWNSLPGIEQAFNFGLGKSKDEGGFPTIFVAGIANGQTGLFRSTDAGATWDQIASYPLGIFDWIDAMDGDKDTFGKVYLAFSGAGFAYGQER